MPQAAKALARGRDPIQRIVFEQAGEYYLMFSAQISSTSSSTVNFLLLAQQSTVQTS
jgi:hypothetical protein